MLSAAALRRGTCVGPRFGVKRETTGFGLASTSNRLGISSGGGGRRDVAIDANTPRGRNFYDDGSEWHGIKSIKEGRA